MTEFATEEIITRDWHAGSIYRHLYTISSEPEVSSQYQPKLVTLPCSTPGTILTHPPSLYPEVWGGQGIVTEANFLLGVVELTACSANWIAQLNAPECFDPRNIVISNFGQGISNILWMNEPIAYAEEPRSISTQAKSALLSDEVCNFAARHQVSTYLQKSLRLAYRNFAELTDIDVSVERDTETEEEWIAICVKVNGDVGHVPDMYDCYTRRFIESVPWPSRDKIRLVYDLI